MITREEVVKYAEESQMDIEIISHLAALYGSRYIRVLEQAEKDSRGKQQLCPHSKDIVAQIWYAVAEESAITVSDFMLRRSGLGLAECQGLDAVDIVAKEMGRYLGWTPAEQQRQVDEYKNIVALTQKFKKG